MPAPILDAARRTLPARPRRATSAARIWSEAQADARALNFHRDPRRLLAGGLGVADALLIVIASGIAHLLRHGLAPVDWDVVSTTALATLLTVNALYIAGAYTAHLTERVPQQTARIARIWTSVFCLLLLLAYLTKTSETYSRAWAIIWFFSALTLLSGLRVAAAAQIARWRAAGRFASTVAIVDLCGAGDKVGTLVRRTYPDDARLVGVFRSGGADGRAGVSELLALSRQFRIDDVLVLISDRQSADATGVFRALASMTANVRACPLLPDLAATPLREVQLFLGLPALTVHRKPLSGWSSVIKRCEDLLLGGVALMLVGPIMLLIAVLIRLESPGPALFRQPRQGFNNNVFTVLKFRSMFHRQEPEGDVKQAVKHDPRVTRIGRFLRRTSLDELPQLLNVLRGEMSLVGPRPHAVSHNELYSTLIDDYIARHRVQPGITGWAQVNGLRGETDTLEKMQRRVEFDLAYIDRWSITFDLRIIALTVITTLFQRTAY